MDTQSIHSTDSNHPIGNKDSGPRLFDLGMLTCILLLAAGLRFTNLSSLGLSNHYYAAAVKSMLQSWHNFFFVAAEPGGSVSVDKPPLGLWLQVISAKFFGLTTIGVLLPQLLAGLLSVILIYHLVKRRFGAPSGLLAALALAITPVAVATDRNNTMDSTLVLSLLLAAWAYIKAAETSRLRYLIAGSVIVGIAFNIKMLEAYLPLPAFLLLYFVGAQENEWRKLGKLALSGLVLLIISLSWAIMVDMTPADQRPYVGSSGDNSEISLIFGYNGVDRLIGLIGRERSYPGFEENTPKIPPPNDGVIPQGEALLPGSPPIAFPYVSYGFPGGAPPVGPINGLGQASALRLFIPPLSKEASWLLPIGLLSLMVMLVSSKITLPVSRQYQAAILWGGWLILAGIFFSIAGFFHEYYLTILAPPLAALVGIGTLQIWNLSMKRLWIASALWVVISGITVVLQCKIASAFSVDFSWLPAVVGLFLLGTIFVIGANLIHSLPQQTLAQLGFTTLLAAVMITPGIWSVLTNLHPTGNQSLPSAYDSRASGVFNYSLVNIDEQLLAHLQANTHGVYYLMAVPSSMQGADYVLATGRPVLYLGGFTGQDEVVTPEKLVSMVSTNKLRFIDWSTSPGGIGDGTTGSGLSQVYTWVNEHCRVVQEYSKGSQNPANPPGLSIVPGDGLPNLGLANVLYDCGR